jgi:hypothetical protein
VSEQQKQEIIQVLMEISDLMVKKRWGDSLNSGYAYGYRSGIMDTLNTIIEPMGPLTKMESLLELKNSLESEHV